MDQWREDLDVGAHDDDVPRLERRVLCEEVNAGIIDGTQFSLLVTVVVLSAVVPDRDRRALVPARPRAGTSGLSADELVEAGMRALFLDQPLPPSLGMLDFMTDTGINGQDLRQAFSHPNEIAEAITRLVVTEGLVGSGRAARIASFTLGPRVGDARRLEIEWFDPRVYTNVEPARRRLEGEWRNG